MSESTLQVLLGFLLWWSLVTAGYAVLLLTVDWLLSAWREWRAQRQSARAQLDQIDIEMRASIIRLSVAVDAARQAMRDTTEQKADRH